MMDLTLRRPFVIFGRGALTAPRKEKRMIAAQAVTRQQARIDAQELLNRVLAESSMITLDEFNRIVTLSRQHEWPLKRGAGPSWVLGETVRELFDQFEFSAVA